MLLAYFCGDAGNRTQVQRSFSNTSTYYRIFFTKTSLALTYKLLNIQNIYRRSFNLHLQIRGKP